MVKRRRSWKDSPVYAWAFAHCKDYGAETTYDGSCIFCPAKAGQKCMRPMIEIVRKNKEKDEGSNLG